ncbi:hypothetical protein [Paraburkholderia sp. BL9I2N2]|uniref:hypothetical protein n=1 Tax=Paraburkholderia sp. BL9I2N2 TaxID=1938809 RepID=UPI0010526A68|nr:hypothetical protein [Paraburkholderia sp. BL9I2N2]
MAALLVTARRGAIERAEKEYKLQCDVFDSADRKAQGATTIAGALLAADLGFVSKLTDTPSLLAIVVLLVITGALGCSVLAALWALFARDSELPATGEECGPGYRKLVSQTSVDTYATAEFELLDFVIEKLKVANHSVATVAANKAGWVHRSQQALIVAAAATIVLTILLIFNPKMLALTTTVQVAPAVVPQAASTPTAAAPATSVSPEPTSFRHAGSAAKAR